jgi:hypothetical protein
MSVLALNEHAIYFERSVRESNPVPLLTKQLVRESNPYREIEGLAS